MLFPTPIGHRVSAAWGEPMLFRAIGKHGPYLGSTTLFALKYDVPSIRGPGRKILSSLVMGELGPAFAGNVHDVDVLPARRAWAVFAVPRKGQELSVRRPRGRGGVTTIGQALYVGSIRIHGVDLGQPSPSAAPCDLRIRFGIPGGRNIRSLESGDLLQAPAVRSPTYKSPDRPCVNPRMPAWRHRSTMPGKAWSRPWMES